MYICRYWELERTDMLKSVGCKNVLPSDCRFREDLIALADRNLPLAAEYAFIYIYIYILGKNIG